MVKYFKIIDSVMGVEMNTHHGKFMSASIQLVGTDGRKNEHICLYRNISHAPCLLRLHSACVTSELFGCTRCDCGWQLKETLAKFQKVTSCAMIYTLSDEGRGRGVVPKLKSYLGTDGTAEGGLHRRYIDARDEREFEYQAFVASWLGIKSAHLLTNNKRKISAIKQQGIQLIEIESLRSNQPIYKKHYEWKDKYL